MLENRVSFIGGKVIKGGNELAKVESVLKTIMAAILVVITIILIVLDLLNKDAIIKRLKHYLNADPADIFEEIVVDPHMAIAKDRIERQIRDGPRSRKLAIENGPKNKSQLLIEASDDESYDESYEERSKKWHKKRDDLEKKFLEEYDIMMEYISPNSKPKKSWVNDDSIENQSHQEIVDESVNDDSIENSSFQEIIDELNQILDANTAYLNKVNTTINTIHTIENEELGDDFGLDQLEAYLDQLEVYLNSINLKNRTNPTIRNGGTRGKGKNPLKTTGSSKKRKRTQKRRKQRK